MNLTMFFELFSLALQFFWLVSFRFSCFLWSFLLWYQILKWVSTSSTDSLWAPVSNIWIWVLPILMFDVYFSHHHIDCDSPAGAAATYVKFFPYIKKNYEYGMVVFLLTFNLITVSSYRVNGVLKIAQQRFYTIAIGCGICLLMSLLVFPNWSGEELHQGTVSKLEGLARSIEGFVPYTNPFISVWEGL